MSKVLIVGGERNGETIEWFGNRVYINGILHVLNRIVFKDGAMVERYVKLDLEQARREGYDPDDQSLPRLPNCTTLAQMSSPTITVPPGLDIQKVGEAYLQVMGMPAEEAARFSQTVDWTTTLVIPIPRYGTTYREVPVDGVTGTLIVEDL